MTAVILFIGFALGAVFLLIARRAGGGERRVLAVGLIVAAVIYVGFALLNGAGGPLLALEAGGVGLYSLFAVLGLRGSAWWLALGWATHTVWDAGLHLLNDGTGFVPSWYAIACISFDLVVAFYVVLRLREWSDHEHEHIAIQSRTGP